MKMFETVEDVERCLADLLAKGMVKIVGRDPDTAEPLFVLTEKGRPPESR